MEKGIRWLHLSDVCTFAPQAGESVSDNEALQQQRQQDLYRKLQDHVVERLDQEKPLHFIFITGDLAHVATEENLSHWRSKFLEPILEKYQDARFDGQPISQPILFVVPGNRDLDSHSFNALSRREVLANRYLSPSTTSRMSALVNRFSHFRDCFAANKSANETESKADEALGRGNPVQDTSWLEHGVFTSETIEVEGKKVVVILANTSLISKENDDFGRISPGALLVKSALDHDRVKDADYTIVLGHHPLDWFDPEEQRTLKELFRLHGAIYLHGHRSDEKASKAKRDETDPLAIQGEAFSLGFNSRRSRAGIVWGEAFGKSIHLERVFFDPEDRENLKGREPEPDQVITIPDRVHHYPPYEFPVDLSIQTTRYVRRTKNRQIVGEHARRGGSEDVGEVELDRSPMTVDEALSYFDQLVLLGEPGSGKSFALEKLCETLQFAYDNNDTGFIGSRYPNWRHAPLPFPIRIDAPTFAEWRFPTDTDADDALFRFAFEGQRAGNDREDSGRRQHVTFEEFHAYCLRESFVLIVDDWGALEKAEAERVNEFLRSAVAQSSKRYRATVIISASLDSAPIEKLFDDDDFERITIAKLEGRDRKDFVERYCEGNGRFTPPPEDFYKLAESPGQLIAILSAYRAAPGMKPPDIGTLRELELKRWLERGGYARLKGKEATQAIDGIGEALCLEYFNNPGMRLLRFEIPSTLMLPNNKRIRRHEGEPIRHSIVDYRIQDYLVGRWLATQILAAKVKVIFDHKSARREPVVHALLKLQDTKPDDVAKVLKALLDSTASHAPNCLAEFLASADRETIDKIEPNLRDQIRTRLVELLGPGVDDVRPRDRFHIGRALGLLGDPRKGTGIGGLNKLFLPEIEWVEISAGTVQLGQTEEDRALYRKRGWAPPDDEKLDNSPKDPYYLSKYPVTNAQFEAFLNDKFFGFKTPEFWQAHNLELSKDGEELNSKPGEENQPATRLTWDRAKAFCKWYSRQTGYAVDLPNSDEWEGAARGKDSRLFAFGPRYEPGRMNSQEEGLPSTTAVGAFPGEPGEISDMSGNVFEWCNDAYDKAKDPDFKVTKGGSYNHDLLRCRNATRGKKHRRSEHPYMGFRLKAASAPPKTKRVVLVGGGFAGTATAIRLLAMAERPLQVVLIERKSELVFGGLAYSEGLASEEHFFNLQAGRISLFRERRGDFVDWLMQNKNDPRVTRYFKASGVEIGPSIFVPRALYQFYLNDRLRTAIAGAAERVSFHLIAGEVTDIDEQSKRVEVRNQDGLCDWLDCDEVVLCTGNLASVLPEGISPSAAASRLYIENQYGDDSRKKLQNLKAHARVVVLGTGLRACDVAMTLLWGGLKHKNETVNIRMISRHGRIHPTYGKTHLHEVVELPPPQFLFEKTLTKQVVVEGVKRAFVEAWNSQDLARFFAEGDPSIPSLRSERILKAWEMYVPILLEKLSSSDLRDLLRDYGSLITVHRIGVVPEIGELITKRRKEGKQLWIDPGKIHEIRGNDSELEVVWSREGESRRRTIDASLVINCLGRERNYAKLKKQYEDGRSIPSFGLWKNLLDRKLVEPHVTEIGINVDALSGLVKVENRESQWISAVGVMREGVEFRDNGRLGSFSFTLGPIKNQALQVAFHTLLRVREDRPPHESLYKQALTKKNSPKVLPKPLEPRKTLEEGLTDCFFDARDAHEAIQKKVTYGNARQLAEQIGFKNIFEVAVNWMKAPSSNARQRHQFDTLETQVKSGLGEIGLDSKDSKKLYFERLWINLQGVALAHLTRLDEAEPGEIVEPEVGMSVKRVEMDDGRAKFQDALDELLTRVRAARIHVPKCFISYAHGVAEHQAWVTQSLDVDLRRAGIQTVIDLDNSRPGNRVDDFVRQVSACEKVIVVGTPLYLKKSRENNVVAREFREISKRLTKSASLHTKQSVIPLLLDGNPDSSLPKPLLDNVRLDFRQKDSYFAELFKLIHSLYGIEPE